MGKGLGLERIRCPKIDDVISRLKVFNWSSFGVIFAIAFGSSISGKGFKWDVDIAVWLDDLEKAVDLQYFLSKHLGVPDYCVDIVVLNNYEFLPCTLIIDVLGKGKPVYYKDLESFLDTKLRILFPCFDFAIDSKKLKLLETQIKTVTKRWGY
jgi:predicted nucleotidyltransferase